MVLWSCWKSRHKNSCGPAPYWIRAGLAVLLCLCVTQFTCSGAVGETTNVVQKDAVFDVTYNDTVTSENQTIYAFNHTISRNKVSLHRQTRTRVIILCVILYVLFLWVSDGGSACVCGCVVTRFRESHPVCGTTKASSGVLSSPSHTKRPVSIQTKETYVECVLQHPM